MLLVLFTHMTLPNSTLLDYVALSQQYYVALGLSCSQKADIIRTQGGYIEWGGEIDKTGARRNW